MLELSLQMSAQGADYYSTLLDNLLLGVLGASLLRSRVRGGLIEARDECGEHGGLARDLRHLGGPHRAAADDAVQPFVLLLQVLVALQGKVGFTYGLRYLWIEEGIR